MVISEFPFLPAPASLLPKTIFNTTFTYQHCLLAIPTAISIILTSLFTFTLPHKYMYSTYCEYAASIAAYDLKL